MSKKIKKFVTKKSKILPKLKFMLNKLLRTFYHTYRPVQTANYFISCIILSSSKKSNILGGLPNWTAYPDGLVNASSLHSQSTSPHAVLVGGLCNYIYELDLTCKGRTLRCVPSGSDGVTLFRTSPSNSRYLYTADNQGNVHCRDPASLTIQHTLCCPFGTIMDFDVCSNLLVTCGHSQSLK